MPITMVANFNWAPDTDPRYPALKVDLNPNEFCALKTNPDWAVQERRLYRVTVDTFLTSTSLRSWLALQWIDQTRAVMPAPGDYYLIADCDQPGAWVRWSQIMAVPAGAMAGRIVLCAYNPAASLSVASAYFRYDSQTCWREDRSYGGWEQYTGAFADLDLAWVTGPEQPTPVPLPI